MVVKKIRLLFFSKSYNLAEKKNHFLIRSPHISLLLLPCQKSTFLVVPFFATNANYHLMFSCRNISTLVLYHIKLFGDYQLNINRTPDRYILVTMVTIPIFIIKQYLRAI